MVKLAGHFEFADSICHDSKGNVYFIDSRWKRIYEWSAADNLLHLISDIQFRPLSIACDTRDNLLVVVEYFPPKGATIGGKPESYPKPPDAQGTAYGTWYNTGSTTKVYAIDPANPDTSMTVLDTVPMDSLKTIAQALYPANRWRDNNDYLTITVRKPTDCFVAPDGVTVIPVCYDLIRANGLLPAIPGKPFYGADEFYKRTVLFDVTAQGYLQNPRVFAERGEYSVATDADGNVYVADGQLYLYDKTGQQTAEYAVPERPACLTFGGKDGKTLFITARSGLYMMVKP